MNRWDRGTACAAALALVVGCGGSAKIDAGNVSGAGSGGSNTSGSGSLDGSARIGSGGSSGSSGDFGGVGGTAGTSNGGGTSGVGGGGTSGASGGGIGGASNRGGPGASGSGGLGTGGLGDFGGAGTVGIGGGSGARGGVGVNGASCIGLAATCGPGGNASCCASSVVPGGTFNRDNDAKYPATVSDFRLDKYEVTVGRFRKFVAAYSRNMIAAGAGANPNNASDTGWSTAWNTSLDASSGSLATALKCDPIYQTWTDAPGSAAAESLPINCADWFQAEAFCIWDGGRLPTEAEWN